jgi:hypothetical protein
MSPRLARFKEFALDWPIPTPKYNEDLPIVDSNDVVIKDPNAYFVTRTDYCKSKVMVGMANQLAEQGILEEILRILENQEQRCSFNQATALMMFVVMIYPIYNRNIA